MYDYESDWEVVIPTIFPDGTSQVWKLKTKIDNSNTYIIKWNFENEAELIHVAQLKCLLGSLRTKLEIPYFPYARQDKDMSNESTFAKFPFLDLLSSMNFYEITAYDIHSRRQGFKHANIQNKRPDYLNEVIQHANPDLIFYPDEGAYKRYSEMFVGENSRLNMLPKGYGTKVRNQSTGVIESYNVVLPSDYIQDYNVLIVDDLCDGGATFIEAAKELKKAGLGQVNVDLAVSHGVFSKGVTHLFENGIRNIYTTNSLTKNKTNSGNVYFTGHDVKVFEV